MVTPQAKHPYKLFFFFFLLGKGITLLLLIMMLLPRAGRLPNCTLLFASPRRRGILKRLGRRSFFFLQHVVVAVVGRQ
jgi:hypothetical protein